MLEKRLVGVPRVGAVSGLAVNHSDMRNVLVLTELVSCMDFGDAEAKCDLKVLFGAHGRRGDRYDLVLVERIRNAINRLLVKPCLEIDAFYAGSHPGADLLDLHCRFFLFMSELCVHARPLRDSRASELKAVLSGIQSSAF
jgi:hypothetical protein